MNFKICQFGTYLLKHSDSNDIIMLIIPMNLFQTRTHYNLTQYEASSIINLPIRTYIRYEKDDNYGDRLKREVMIRAINDHCEITETKGLLNINFIKSELTKLFDSEYKGDIEFCYLFGSYAKGYATELSDVDLCVSTTLSGLKFIGLSESIRQILHKNIDLVRLSNLKDNIDLVNEIMKDGIKIYE